MLARSWCDHCGRRELAQRLTAVLTTRATFSAPAEYEEWCPRCAPVEQERDEDYERMAARYDGTGKDWR